MIASVDFSEYTDANGDNMMLDAFVDGLGKRLNEQKYIMADTDNHIVWYMWYSEVLM